MTDQAIPEGYWKDAEGNLVPDANVKEVHKLEDELVRQLVDEARPLSTALAEFKAGALEQSAAFKSLLADEYEVKKGGKKGNMTLRTYDGAFEVQVAVSDSITFGPELQVAKDLIDQCVEDWSEGANDNIRALVNHAFQVSKEGRIDTGRVLGLRKLAIEDTTWARAMDAIGDAVRTTHSKTYIRFYEVDPETGVRSSISLDLAAV